MKLNKLNYSFYKTKFKMMKNIKLLMIKICLVFKILKMFK
jgi:hypothetical protein